MRVKVNAKLGLVLVIISCLLWATVLAVPFLPASLAQKALVTASLLIVSEVTFWLGILLAGKELARRYRRKLNPYYWWQRVSNGK